MAKKLGKSEKTLLIAAGVGLGVYLLYKGISSGSSSSSAVTYNGGTNYSGTQSGGGNGSSITEVVNTGLEIVKDGLNKVELGGGSASSSAQKAVLKVVFETYKIAYDAMISSGTQQYSMPNGTVVTLAQVRSVLQQLNSKYGWTY